MRNVAWLIEWSDGEVRWLGGAAYPTRARARDSIRGATDDCGPVSARIVKYVREPKDGETFA